MKKKITIKDIAREANVSVATVSYILNKRTDQKISEATVNKVLQIVNLFGYTSNQSARTLATGVSGNIAVYLADTDSSATCQMQFEFLNKFSKVLDNCNKSLVYFYPSRLERQTNTDAIICFNLDRDMFYKIGNNNFVPLIAVDSFINDPLFFQINNNYAFIYQKTVEHFSSNDFILFFNDTKNNLLKEHLLSIFPSVYFSGSITADADFLAQNQSKKFLVLNDSFAKIFSNQYNVFNFNTFSKQKLNKVLECVDLALKRLIIENHDIKV